MNDEQTFDQTDPLIGLLVDERYRVTRRLARGGMATVYIAQDERLDRPVALKVMHPHLADSADFVARFRREARSAARIVHPGVVSVFDQGVVTGQGFLVMELIDGTSLRALLNAQGAFTIPQALRYTTDILEALRAAYRMGVIHRDIKPENILVPTDGPAKVTDFGLARAASEVSMSSTGNMLGTVAYIAPEIATTAEADEPMPPPWGIRLTQRISKPACGGPTASTPARSACTTRLSSSVGTVSAPTPSTMTRVVPVIGRTETSS